VVQSAVRRVDCRLGSLGVLRAFVLHVRTFCCVRSYDFPISVHVRVELFGPRARAFPIATWVGPWNSTISASERSFSPLLSRRKATRSATQRPSLVSEGGQAQARSVARDDRDEALILLTAREGPAKVKVRCSPRSGGGGAAASAELITQSP